MKTFLLFLSLTFLSFIIYTSCAPDQIEIQQDYSIQNVKKIIDEFNGGKLEQNQASLKKGAVEIVSTENEIVLFVTENGKQNLMYILQVDPVNLKKGFRKTISSAEILFMRRSLLINSLDEDFKILFNVDQNVPLEFSGFDFKYTFKGFGLVEQKNMVLTYTSIEDFHGISTIYSVRKSPTKGQVGLRSNDEGDGVQSAVECGCCTGETVETVCVDLATGNCDAGGPGSTSCSISVPGENGGQYSCSSVCSGSATPCCNDTSNDN